MAVVTDLGTILRRLIGEDVILATSLYPDLPAVHADPGQVEQILLNLAVNARDAMPQGGRLTIQTVPLELDTRTCQGHPLGRPGRFVMIAVSDTGRGMDAYTRDHLFEPFFTTKEFGEGTGLGLATVYAIVRQSDGHIEVDSQPGCGTTFKVYFPQIDVPAPAPHAAAVPPNGAPSPSRTVLLAEDDEGVRALGRQFLRAKGYTVLEARDGREALQVYEEHAGTIDLVIADLVMPEMDGRQLASMLAHLRRDLKVLFMSGHAEEILIGRGMVGAGVPFLPKPFTADSLARKVSELLERP